MSQDQSKKTTIITYSVLVGLSPLVPVPFVDDWLINYFRRRMVRSLASSNGLEFSDETISILADDRDKKGCLWGCLSSVVFYPLKKIFRKIFYFLEWKRAVDLTSHTYHFGYLLNYALRDGFIKSDAKSLEDIRTSLDDVCNDTPIKPVESVVSGTFRQTKGLIFSGVEILEKTFRNLKKKPTEDDISVAAAKVEEEEKEQLEGITNSLGKAISNIPEEHFKMMREKFSAKMKALEQQSPAELENEQADR
jgi:hypothetical protein